MEEKIICPNCKTENDSEFTFCKNCGSNLVAPHQTPPQNNYNDFSNEQVDSQQTIDGVTIENINEFVGKKNYSFVTKFQKMSMLGKKAGWNWAVFLFGFFLNIPFVWFFHRKMKKIGAIILAISLAFSICNIAIFYSNFKEISDLSYKYFESHQDQLIDYSNKIYENNILNESNEKIYLYDNPFQNKSEMEEFLKQNNLDAVVIKISIMQIILYILGLVHLIYIVLISIYANYWYKNHCIKTIKDTEFKKINKQSVIQEKGGTANALAITSGILFKVILGVVYIAVFVYTLLPIFELIFKILNSSI